MEKLLISIATLTALALSVGCSEDAPGTAAGADTTPDTPAQTEVTPEPDEGPPEVQGDSDPPPAPCIPTPPAEALEPAGVNEGGAWLPVGARAVTPAGPNTVLAGFPTDVAIHPDGDQIYVSSASRGVRRLQVLDAETREVTQEIDRDEAFYGLEMAPDGSRIYASGGHSSLVEVYERQPDDTLARVGEIEVSGYPSGLALSPDGKTLWVGKFASPKIAEIDTETLTEVRELPAGHPIWDVVYVPGRQEIYASGLQSEGISVVDLTTGELVEVIDMPTSPAGMAVHPDGSRVWAAVSGGDYVAEIDTESREVLAKAPVAEDDYVDASGEPLPNSNVNALSYDAAGNRLYASRGADNAVSVLDASSMQLLGSVPTSHYPTDVQLSPDGQTLVIVEGKGGGVGPNEGKSAKTRSDGSVTFVDVSGLNLTESTAQVIENNARPRLVFPFECDGDFPVPTKPGQQSPIEHVVLIVKENKTFDCVFGDLEDLDVVRDPSLVRWGEDITPNQHALARQFNVGDNFFVETPNSDTGHLFLTSVHLTEYVERVWIEKTRTGRFEGYQLDLASVPDVGNLFSHLDAHGVSVRIYGEIVGTSTPRKGGGTVLELSDPEYPGGPFTNYAFTDQEKVEYVAGKIDEGELAQFTFLLLPNDHTNGTTEGFPTPESMVADNDYAVGLFIDRLSRSPFWEKSAVFIVQDDPQGCDDSVDALRSFVLVISPWARRGYVSKVHASFLSVFATIERILGVPPLGRQDAAASPLWDMFTAEMDATPFDAVPRVVPPEINGRGLPGAEASARMDFRSPDRNPELAIVLDAYRLWRMGKITKEEAQRRIDDKVIDEDRYEELEEEAEEEVFAFDRAWAWYERHLRARGKTPPKLSRLPRRR